PRCGNDVARNAPAQKAPHESEQPQFARGKPTLTGIATETFAVPPSHKMSRTRRAGGLNQQLAIRANRLKAVMFDDDRLARQKAENKRRQRWTCNMNDIG